MKYRSFWLMIPVALLACWGCDKKQSSAQSSAPEIPAPTVSTAALVTPAAPLLVTTEAPAAPAPAPAGQRADKLGFVRYLPADTEAVISIQNGGKIAERAGNLKLWQLMQEGVGGMFGAPMMGQGRDFEMPPDGEMMEDEDFAIPEEDSEEKETEKAPKDEGAAIPRQSPGGMMLVTADGPDPDSEEAKAAAARRAAIAGAAIGGAEPDDEDGPEPDAQPMNEGELGMGEMQEMPSITEVLGMEITMAVGKPAGAQLTNLVTAYERFYHFMTRGMTRKFGEQLKEGNFDSPEPFEGEEELMQLFNDLLADPESGFGLLERASMPPVYLAFRGAPEKCEAVAKSLNMQLDGMGEDFPSEPITIEKAGAKLSGLKISGAQIVEEMDDMDREQMAEALGNENTTKLLDLFAKKNLVVAVGTLGEYVVMFIGSSEADFALTANPAESLAAGKALEFADAYADRELVALVYGSEPAAKALYGSSSGLSLYANAIREGLAAWDGPVETRDLETLLQNLAERETALRKMATTDAGGIVAFFDQGLRVESFGGYDAGGIDWETPCKLAHLGESPEVAFFANMTSKPSYDKASLAYLESIAAVAYAAASKATELEIEDDDLDQVKEFMGVFNGKFRANMASVWDALSTGLGGGLGQETAIVVDLNGTMPTIPSVPQTVVDKAKFPRATLISPVTDRDKLRAAWTQVHASSTKLLAALSEEMGEDIPMHQPIDSEKDGFTTWFFSLPFQTRDFIPSVTVSDKWFAASTSRQRALELLGKVDQAGTPRTGVWVRVNFAPIRDCAAETIKMIEDNAAEIFGEDSSEIDTLEQTKELRTKLIDALAELDSITAHARRENGTLRTSIHFKTR